MSSISSQTQIANRALTKLGSERILDLTDNTKRARVMYSMFDTVRDDELRAHLWRFAITRTTVPSVADATPAFDYDYAYGLPSDCIRLIQVNDYYIANSLAPYITSDDAPFSLESNQILANFASPLKIRYVKRVTDTTQYDPCFVEALACRLAAEACETITQSANKRKAAWQEYELAIRKAISANVLETAPTSFADDAWVLSRL